VNVFQRQAGGFSLIIDENRPVGTVKQTMRSEGSMSGNGTREKICEAAIRKASRDGLLAMTLDNVAKEAGVSKGGVMYHFPSKDDLVRGVVEYFGEQVERMVLQRIADDPEPRYRWARSILSCTFPENQVVSTDDRSIPPDLMDQFMLASLAAAVNSPGLIEPLRQVGLRLSRRLLNDTEDGLEQLLIWLVLDGLFLWQFVGLIHRDDPLYSQIGEALRAKVAAGSRSVTRPMAITGKVQS
jgi:AcrR family transcriptional regulator